MVSYNFSKEFIDRFSAFLDSTVYHQHLGYAKSDYWEYQSKKISVEIYGNTVTVGGKSGYYVPPSKATLSNIKNKLIKAYQHPSEVIRFLIAEWHRSPKDSPIQLLNYFDAFDAVMSHDPITDIDLATYRINFQSLSTNEGVVSSVEEMERGYFAKNKYQLNPQMVYAYYLSNIINGYIKKKPNTILEIGAGNGNLASLLYHSFEPTIIIVDLSETLCLSIPFIADLFRDKKILMPHESHLYDFDSCDFVFLTPSQIGIIKGNSVDLSICVHAFQEMTHQQIKEYFKLIQRVSHDGSHFLCCSRVEKIPASFVERKETGVPVNRFLGYPWNPNNEVMVYEVCKLMRLVQLDNTYIRLERILKDETTKCK